MRKEELIKKIDILILLISAVGMSVGMILLLLDYPGMLVLASVLMFMLVLFRFLIKEYKYENKTSVKPTIKKVSKTELNKIKNKTIDYKIEIKFQAKNNDTLEEYIVKLHNIIVNKHIDDCARNDESYAIKEAVKKQNEQIKK